MSQEFNIPPDALARQKMLQEHLKSHRVNLGESVGNGTSRSDSKSRDDEPHEDGSDERTRVA